MKYGEVQESTIYGHISTKVTLPGLKNREFMIFLKLFSKYHHPLKTKIFSCTMSLLDLPFPKTNKKRHH